ncbi:hypothetical protein GCM10010228_67240 [Streptomyces massasporeus]|nr:hypothetical protein GCM10010228_67240 [Streptomyces massasporeus]
MLPGEAFFAPVEHVSVERAAEHICAEPCGVAACAEQMCCFVGNYHKREHS